MFGVRFDRRDAAFAGVSMVERDQAALDMAAGADELGAFLVVLSEHPGSDDGSLPSLIPLSGHRVDSESTRSLRRTLPTSVLGSSPTQWKATGTL